VAAGSIVLIQINFLAEHESIRYNAVHYGYSIDHSCRSYRWRNREAIDAGERSWWFYRHDSARHRWRVYCHLPRPSLGWYKAGQPAGWIMSVVGAMILLLLYRFLFKRGA